MSTGNLDDGRCNPNQKTHLLGAPLCDALPAENVSTLGDRRVPARRQAECALWRVGMRFRLARIFGRARFATRMAHTRES